jgi:SAM-dependent methyltransferase
VRPFLDRTMASLEQDPAAFWNGPAAERWVALQELTDPLLAVFGEAGMEAGRIGPADRVLDVGCGCGATTIEIARRVGADGRVVGVDVSGPMLAVARRRAAEAGLANVELIEADAGAVELPRAFDVIYSRFGWMFFADSVAALRHLRGAAVAGGRLAFVGWRGIAENDWATVPLEAVSSLVALPPPSSPDAPGPFAFGDRSRIERVLAAAGWVDVAVVPFDRPYAIGTDLEGAVRFAMQLGPAARALADAGLATDDALRDRARTVLTDALAAHVGPDGAVTMRGATWLVTAVAPR